MNYLTFPVGYNEENNTFILISKFKIEIKLLIDIYEIEIDFNKKVCPKLPPDAPRQKEFREITKLSNKLKECVIKNIDVDFKNPYYIDVFCSQIIFDKKFESVYCAECKTGYNKDEVKVESWSEGESLFAQGGRLMKCPKEHLVYELMEWNS